MVGKITSKIRNRVEKVDWNKFFSINKIPYSILKIEYNQSTTNNHEEILSFIDSLAQISVKKNQAMRVLNGNWIDLFMPNNDAVLEVNRNTQYLPIWWEIMFSDGKVNFYIHVPKENVDQVENQLKRTWRGCNVVNIEEDYLKEWDKETTEAIQFDLLKEDVLSLAVDRRTLPLYGILQAFKNLNKEDQALFQLGMKYSPAWNKDVEGKLDDIKENGSSMITKISDLTISGFLGAGMKRVVWLFGLLLEELANFGFSLFNPKHKDWDDMRNLYKNMLPEITSSSKNKQSRPAFTSNIRLCIQSKNDTRRDTFIKNVESSMVEMNENNEWKVKRVPIKCMGRKITGHRTVLSDKEICKLTGLPDREMQRIFGNNIKGVVGEKVDAPKILLDPRGIPIAVYKGSDGKSRLVHFPLANMNDFIKSKYFIGATRSGKSTAGVNFVIECFKKGFGSCFIDIAHGKTLNEITSVLTKEEREKVAVLNFKQASMSIALGFNELLMNPDNTYQNIDTIVDEVIYFFENLGGHKINMRARRWLTTATKSVMTHPDASILDVILMLTDSKYREETIKKIENPFLKSDWEVFWDNKLSDARKDQIIMECFARMDLLLQNDVIRNTVMSRPKKDEHGEYIVNFKKWMDEGWIVLIQLSDKDITASTAIASLLISKMFLTTLDRNEESRPFHIVIDEPHKVIKSAERMRRILVECAKYRVGILALIHEWSQLKEVDRELPDTFINNAGHFIYFNTGVNNFSKIDHKLEPFDYDYREVPNMLQEHEGIMVFNASGKDTPPIIAKGLDKVENRYPTTEVKSVFDRDLDLYGLPSKQVTEQIFAEMQNANLDGSEYSDNSEAFTENVNTDSESHEKDVIDRLEFNNQMERELNRYRKI